MTGDLKKGKELKNSTLGKVAFCFAVIGLIIIVFFGNIVDILQDIFPSDGGWGILYLLMGTLFLCMIIAFVVGFDALSKKGKNTIDIADLGLDAKDQEKASIKYLSILFGFHGNTDDPDNLAAKREYAKYKKDYKNTLAIVAMVVSGVFLGFILLQYLLGEIM